MKSFPVLLIILLSACQHSAVSSFADRVARAEALEKTPAGADFVGELVKEQTASLNAIADECYTEGALGNEVFVLVADIDSNGKFSNVAVQPESTPTRCFADKFAKLQTSAPRPAGSAGTALPFFLEVNFKK